MDLPVPKQRTISRKPDGTVSVPGEPPGQSNGDAGLPSDKLLQEFRGLWAKGDQLTAADVWAQDDRAASVGECRDRCRELRFAPDGRTVISGSGDSTALVWNAMLP